MTFLALWGTLVWLAATLCFRFAGQWLLDPNSPVLLGMTVAAVIPLVAAITYPLFAWRKAGPGQRPIAAILTAVPGMLLDVLSVSLFPTLFPNMSPEADKLFGAWLLWAYSLILITGIVPGKAAGGPRPGVEGSGVHPFTISRIA